MYILHTRDYKNQFPIGLSEYHCRVILYRVRFVIKCYLNAIIVIVNKYYYCNQL